jgi:hypothetical protein
MAPIVAIDNMEITTIQLSKETKDRICSFGVKGESYDVILNRIYSLALKEQLRDFLMSDKGFIPIEDAIKEANKKWPK